jgi:uncharacterized membrane-anchored protein YhcB (DUF1043 family)
MDIIHLDLTLIVQLISALLVLGLLPIGLIIYMVRTRNNIQKNNDKVSTKLDRIIELLENRQKELN